MIYEHQGCLSTKTLEQKQKEELKQHKSSACYSVMGKCVSEEQVLSRWAGTSYWGDPTVCRCGNPTEVRVNVPTEQDQGQPEKGCSSDYQPVDPGLSYYAACVYADTFLCVSSYILMGCPCVQTYCTQMLSLASGLAWAHQNLSSQPGTRCKVWQTQVYQSGKEESLGDRCT